MAKRIKKRGVKPGTKRGRYKKAKRPSRITLDSPQYAKLFEVGDAKIGSQLRIRLPNEDWAKLNTVGNLPSLMTELQSTISQLEGQLTAQIDRIKSILV